MTYQETIDFLFAQRPSFERQGASGYKPGLEVTQRLAQAFGNPQDQLRVIHIAGTNGKGSVAHMLAAVLQAQGYKVGLYTSPHFVDFTERIRINGAMIPRQYVIDFVEKYQTLHSADTPTFFEFTTVMAMRYFADNNVDYTVLETGLGGRLDSTNIVTPMLSIITNIGLEHTNLLGNTIEEIAGEKAGIIKRGVPVVIGEAPQAGVREVFVKRAAKMKAPITFAGEQPYVQGWHKRGRLMLFHNRPYGTLYCDLIGDYQVKNVATALTAIEVLKSEGVAIDMASVKHGLSHVQAFTGFRGRWTVLGRRPLILCDSAHNPDAMRQVMSQLKQLRYRTLRMVLGFMADKDVERILSILPADAQYYFTQAQTPRSLSVTSLTKRAHMHRLYGSPYGNVSEALAAAKRDALATDVIYVGGSMYLLAELFSAIDKQ